jgi:hypothetical protein
MENGLQEAFLEDFGEGLGMVGLLGGPDGIEFVFEPLAEGISSAPAGLKGIEGSKVSADGAELRILHFRLQDFGFLIYNTLFLFVLSRGFAIAEETAPAGKVIEGAPEFEEFEFSVEGLGAEVVGIGGGVEKHEGNRVGGIVGAEMAVEFTGGEKPRPLERMKEFPAAPGAPVQKSAATAGLSAIQAARGLFSFFQKIDSRLKDANSSIPDACGFSVGRIQEHPAKRIGAEVQAKNEIRINRGCHCVFSLTRMEYLLYHPF